jgi:hypothetical protein
MAAIQEVSMCGGTALPVDKEKGVISGVKILGMKSKNGRTYTPECLQNAANLYEGAKVNVDHPVAPGRPRSYQDRIGSLSNIQLQASGLYGDLHFNPKHALAEQLVWDATHTPENVGFSHDVEATTSRKGGAMFVEAVTKVYSVDLVADPATTRGLFESEELPEATDHRELCEHGLSAMSDARLILLGPDPIPDKKSRLLEVLSVWQAELAGPAATDKETTTMEWKEITREGLEANRKDLTDILVNADSTNKLKAEVLALTEAVQARDTELAAVQAAMKAIETEKAAQAKTLAIREELQAAKLDITDKVAVSEAFMGTLTAAADAEARKRLIEDRATVLRGRFEPIRGAAPFGKVDADQPKSPGPGTTKEETLARL